MQDIYLPYNMSSCRLDDVRVGPFTGFITTDKHFIKLFIMCIHLLPLCRNSPQSQMFGATVFCCGRPSLMDVNLTPRWYVAILFFLLYFCIVFLFILFPPHFSRALDTSVIYSCLDQAVTHLPFHVCLYKLCY